MKAMILAAGLGTRLRPLTDNRPKALVEVAGRTLLEITLSRLSSFGVCDVIINVHHFPDRILDYLKAHNNFGLHIEISREERLLDTGGGLKKASWFFLQDSQHSEEPFILHNVDVISTFDLRRMADFHNEKQALATLAVQHRESSRQLLFDGNLRLCGRKLDQDQKPKIVRSSPNLQPFAFSGIHIISPRLLRLMEEQDVFSIIDTYLHLSAHGENILAFPARDAYWRDLGKPADLAQAAHDLNQKGLL
jgi:NDP-sugar pyrophosphorylase family protein